MTAVDRGAVERHRLTSRTSAVATERVSRQKRYHYIPESYQRQFANESGRVAHLGPGGVSVGRPRRFFGLNEGSAPLFDEGEVTRQEQTLMHIVGSLNAIELPKLDCDLRWLGRQRRRGLPPVRLPGLCDAQDKFCEIAVLQATREPSWRDAHQRWLAHRQMTHAEYLNHLARHGDPYTVAADALSSQHGLTVIESTRMDFIFGSQFVTPLKGGGFIVPLGRTRAAVLTPDRSYGASTVPGNVVAQRNKQILTQAAFCGGHPSTKQFLTHNQKRLGARRQPYALVEFDPRLLAA